MPRISVIIPTFNQGAFLARALVSVQAQSERDWEAIVINNYSDDDTVSVVEQCNDRRISLVNFRNNGVIAASRNVGLGRARAEWIAFLDSDDAWLPDKLATSLAAATAHPEADIVAHQEHSVDGGRVVSTLPCPSSQRTTYRGLLFGGNCFSTTAIMVRSSCLRSAGGFAEDPALVTAEDYDLWLRLVKGGARTCFIPQVLSEYTLHGASATSAVHRHLAASLAVIDRHWADLSPKLPLDALRVRRIRALALYSAGRSLQRRGERGAALGMLATSLGTSPFSLRAWISLLLAAAGSRR